MQRVFAEIPRAVAHPELQAIRCPITGGSTWQVGPHGQVLPGARTEAPEAEPSERTLEERYAPASPFELFGRWLDEAYAAAIPWPHVTVLATSTADGESSARTVMLERFDPSSFVFHTNLNGPKCRDLAQNPRAALVFLWSALGRQVRIAGEVVPRIGPRRKPISGPRHAVSSS